MGIETTIIPTMRQVIYDTYASFPTSGLSIGDLAWATDRKCLYRWSGSAWESVSISSRHGLYADRGNAADYPESSLYQADDMSTLYMVVSGAWVAVSIYNMTFSFGASDVLKNSDDTAKSTTATSYTKLKEVKVNEAYSGIMRIKFDLKLSSTGTGYGKIYKNGVAIGTEQTITVTSYTTFSEDLALTLVANDLLQVYCKGVGGDTVYVQNLRFYYSNRVNVLNGQTVESTLLVTVAAISTTNQDP